MSEGFEIPNRFGAVTSSLTILCSVLISFSSAYFIGITLSDAPSLESKDHLFSIISCLNQYNVRQVIQATSLIASFLLLLSLISSFNVQAFTYDEANYDGDPNEITENRKSYWKNKKRKNASLAYMSFHIALPLLGISLISLVSGSLNWVAIIVIVVTICWILFG